MKGISRWVKGCVVLVLGLGLLPGAVAEATAQEGQYIGGIRFPYELKAPADWYMTVSVGPSVLAAFHPERPDEENPYPFISLTAEYGTEYVPLKPNKVLEDRIYQHPAGRVLESRLIEREDHTMLLADCAWNSVLGSIRAYIAAVPYECNVLIITCVARYDEFTQYEPLFMETLESLQLKKRTELPNPTPGGPPYDEAVYFVPDDD